MNARLVGTLVSAGVAGVVLAAVALAPRPPAPDPNVPVWVDREWQGMGPWCLPTATAVVARAQGYGDVDAKALAREARVDRDGIAWTEMVRVLRAQGIDARLVYPEVPALQDLLRYGPVVISQDNGGADHAIVVEAWEPDRARWRVMDPANPAVQDRPAGSIEPSYERSLKHAIVILPKR